MSHLSGGKFWNNMLRRYYRNLNSIVGTYKEGELYYKNINHHSYTIHNMMDEYCERATHISIEKKKNIISVVARLDPEKNITEFLEIIHEAKTPKDWVINIIGDGHQRDQLERFIQKHHLHQVHLLGSKGIDEVYELISFSKINCLTSVVEALPTILIQAQFFSNALVAYNCNYGPGDIINEENGFLIPLHNKKMFKEKLEYLTQNEEVLSKLMKSSFEESQKWKKEKILHEWKKIL
jgi:glycosyltransferase involved in cell wall biosynthesis